MGAGMRCGLQSTRIWLHWHARLLCHGATCFASLEGVCPAGGRRGIYEVAQTYGEDSGQPDSSPWARQAGGQYMAWLALQAVGARPQRSQTVARAWHLSRACALWRLWWRLAQRRACKQKMAALCHWQQPCGVYYAGYMALTLLVESGWLGTLCGAVASGVSRCWGGVTGRRRRHGGALYERMRGEGDVEGSLLPDLASMEDEDVRAERLALQAGAFPSPFLHLTRALQLTGVGKAGSVAAACFVAVRMQGWRRWRSLHVLRDLPDFACSRPVDRQGPADVRPSLRNHSTGPFACRGGAARLAGAGGRTGQGVLQGPLGGACSGADRPVAGRGRRELLWAAGRQWRRQDHRLPAAHRCRACAWVLAGSACMQRDPGHAGTKP